MKNMSASNTSPQDTKTHILNVAERHFGMFGFAGTSLRGIIKDANVNVAAVAYHFGSKEDLYAAVTERFAMPVVEQQLTRLRSAMQRKNVTLTDVLRAFYEPPIALIKKLGAKGESLSLFLGRSHSEPDPVFSMIDKHYASCRDEFIDALRKLLPNRTEADYQWGFEFMLGIIVSFLTRNTYVRRRYTSSANWQVDEVVDMLIGFCASGMSAPSSRARGKR